MHNRWRLICALSLLLIGPVFALAQEHAAPAEPAAETVHVEHDAAAGGHGDTAHGEKPPLLQFDPGAAIWTIIVFILLLILLRVTAWKPILRVLNDREAFIRESIEHAKREREASEKLLAEYKAQLDQARSEATAIVDEGRRDAEVVRKRLQEEARAEADALLQRARREIGLARDTAIKELYDKTAELAVQVAGQVISKELSADDHRRLVDESLAQMRTVDGSKLN